LREGPCSISEFGHHVRRSVGLLPMTRLAKFLGLVLQGKRGIRNASDTKLLLEAICDQENHQSCVEKLVASSQVFLVAALTEAAVAVMVLLSADDADAAVDVDAGGRRNQALEPVRHLAQLDRVQQCRRAGQPERVRQAVCHLVVGPVCVLAP